MKNLVLLFLFTFVWVLLLPLYPSDKPQTKEIPDDGYVLNVMLGMGTDILPDEALKAVAVTVRTYTAYHGKILPEGSVTEVEAKTSRAHADKVYAAMERAVKATSGQYLTYSGAVIDACFHVSSHISTADGGTPYLKSVATPDESGCKGYYTQTAFVSRHGVIISLSYGADGRVTAVQTEKGEVSVSEFCETYGVPSNFFTVNALPDGRYRVTSYGVGNGLGLSLYGAYLKALSGENYIQILSHYFTNTTITQWQS